MLIDLKFNSLVEIVYDIKLDSNFHESQFLMRGKASLTKLTK